MSASLLAALLLSIVLASAASAAPKKKGGKGGASTSEGPDLDAAARREIPCPKGFVAAKTEGPHLVLTDAPKKTAAKARGKKAAEAEAAPQTRTLSRRCVPEASPAKPASADAQKRRSAAEALR